MDFERDRFKNEHHVNKLNPQQKEIYRYVRDNPDSMILIQAGPGTGKTYTLKTLTYWLERYTRVVIYKHDLLRYFEDSDSTMTVASFMMNLLGIGNLFKFSNLELKLSSTKSAYECATNILALLMTSSIKLLGLQKGALVIIDEYTIVPKYYLFTILTILRFYNVGVILCGDKNQMQNIHNSNFIKSTSYDIGAMFADKVFTLNINERCSDPEYNEIVDYVSQYSSSTRMN